MPGLSLRESRWVRQFACSATRAIRRFEFIEWWILSLLVAGLAWVPFRYGSNELLAWGINAIVFPGLVVLYETSLLIRRKPHPIGLRYVAIPGALFATTVLWIAFQISISVPSALVNPIWGMAADALGRPLDGSISVDRDLTILALIRLITAASVFWLALQLCRNGARAGIIIQSAAAIGCLYAAYGLAVIKTGQLAWLDIPATGGRVSSTFVNPNSFATYAGMGLVAIVGRILQRYPDESIAAVNWRLRFASFIEATGGEGAALLAGAFLLMAALLLTGSRGAVASTGLALGVLCVLVHRRGGSRNSNRQLYAPLLVGLVLVAATLGAFGGAVAGNLDERGTADANRMSVYLLTLRSIVDRPLLGYGYGTFIDVFPMYRDRSIGVAGIWGQAHDTYLEVFQGLGLVFGTALIATVVMLALRCARGSARRQENAIVPAVAASATCLVGVHALVDFSLQMQAVTLTFMVILGAGVAQSASSRRALED